MQHTARSHRAGACQGRKGGGRGSKLPPEATAASAAAKRTRPWLEPEKRLEPGATARRRRRFGSRPNRPRAHL
eukprot:5308404-Prymnesium_polylepis.1